MRIIKPTLLSILVAVFCYFMAPLAVFMSLLAGIAALPYNNFIILILIIAVVYIPGLVVNISMTEKYKTTERVIILMAYFVVVTLICFLFMGYFKNAASSFGQF